MTDPRTLEQRRLDERRKFAYDVLAEFKALGADTVRLIDGYPHVYFPAAAPKVRSGLLANLVEYRAEIATIVLLRSSRISGGLRATLRATIGRQCGTSSTSTKKP